MGLPMHDAGQNMCRSQVSHHQGHRATGLCSRCGLRSCRPDPDRAGGPRCTNCAEYAFSNCRSGRRGRVGGCPSGGSGASKHRPCPQTDGLVRRSFPHHRLAGIPTGVSVPRNISVVGFDNVAGLGDENAADSARTGRPAGTTEQPHSADSDCPGKFGSALGLSRTRRC